ncbi:hypothetical protein DV736_g2559, partial [Chaetothyriales sp. CBS 134916]
MHPRNKHFCSREPFEHNDLPLRYAEGPVKFLNPTRAHFSNPLKSKSHNNDAKSDVTVRSELNGKANNDQQSSTHSKEETDVPASAVEFLWRSRDNRKGRHALLVQSPTAGEEPQFLVPRPTSHYQEVLKNIKLTFTYFPVWDISWVVAVIFTLGSCVWVINAFFVWLPLVAPSTEFHNEIYIGGGVTAFIGAIIFFEVGSVLLIFEAINANNSGCFGWAVEQLGQEKAGGKPKYRFRRGWQWFPSWQDLRTHYFHELGFLAGAAQLFGATIFGISGFTALPGIQNHLTSHGALNGAYWIPQVIGGSSFIVSSILYMLETQQKWWKPAFHLLGWNVGFWNFLGAIGFTLCGALGMAYGNSGAQFQASLATFWGSWAFLIGSYLQLYESLDTHPVEEGSSKGAFEMT